MGIAYTLDFILMLRIPPIILNYVSIQFSVDIHWNLH